MTTHTPDEPGQSTIPGPQDTQAHATQSPTGPRPAPDRDPLMKLTVGKKIGAGFALGLIILVIIGAVSYNSTNKLVQTSEWVNHTHTVIGHLSYALQGLTDAETGARGYVLSGEEPFLEPYRSGLVKAEQAAAEVRNLTRDNDRQQQRCGVLESMIDDRVAELGRLVDLRRAQGHEAALQLITSGRIKQSMDELRRHIDEMKDEEYALLDNRRTQAGAMALTTKRTILIGTALAFGVMFAGAYLITSHIARRLRAITVRARNIANGDLTGDDLLVRSRDEVGELGLAFNLMRQGLREMTSQIRTATENVNATAAEILAATQQQAGATREQAAAVQQITSTLEEISQSGGQIGDRAKQVSTTVEFSSQATQRGMKATQDASLSMEAIRDQVGQVAENVVGLSERTQTIGEIIATVAEISEQSNLLALNAGIEAVSAGDQGSRFGVVAHEMKNLADRAKDCTGQVRSILSEIQRGINTSVMLTEEAVKRVDGGKSQSLATETTIREVTSANDESIQAFQQIVAGTNQQQIGVTQVTQGMQDIRQSIKQTAASVSQLEKAAANMNALSQQLHRVVETYRI